MKAIVAIDKLWGIGKDGDLLFRIKEDMEFFKKMTMGKVVVMGRKTYESLPNGPLKGRINLVITNKLYPDHDNVIFGDLHEINEKLKNYDTDDIFIIGGGSIYKQFIHRCDTVYVTHNMNVYEADTYMPNLAFEGFAFNKFVKRNDNWCIEEWVISECKPYKSVLWFSDSANNVIFLYLDDLKHLKGVYSNNHKILTDEFKEAIECGEGRMESCKIYNYYKAEWIGENINFKAVSFGCTKSEAWDNLRKFIIYLFK